MTFDPSTAAPESDTPFDPASAQEDRTPLRTALKAAVPEDPDNSAKAAAYSRKLHVPMDAVARNLQSIELQDTVMQYDQQLQTSPKLAKAMQDSQALARMAHDDIKPLGEIEQFLKDTGGSATAGYFNAQKGAAGVFRGAAELVAPIFDNLENAPEIGGNPFRRLAEGFDLIATRNDANATAATPKTTGNISGGFQSGVQSLIQNGLVLPMAFINPQAGLAAMVSMTGGQAYQDAREKGIPMTTAVPFAASQAAIEYATEVMPMTKLIGDVKAGTGLLKTLATQMGLEIPGEQVATLLQDMNEWAVLNPEKPFSAYIAERPNAAAQTLIATMVGVGGNVAVTKGIEAAVKQMVGETDEHAQATAYADNLQKMLSSANASALRERSPEDFRQLVQQMADEPGGAPRPCTSTQR